MNRLLKKGVMERRESAWSANNLFVPKKYFGTNLNTDFGSLNFVTIGYQYSMEVLKETLDSILSKTIFTTFILINITELKWTKNLIL